MQNIRAIRRQCQANVPPFLSGRVFGRLSFIARVPHYPVCLPFAAVGASLLSASHSPTGRSRTSAYLRPFTYFGLMPVLAPPRCRFARFLSLFFYSFFLVAVVLCLGASHSSFSFYLCRYFSLASSTNYRLRGLGISLRALIKKLDFNLISREIEVYLRPADAGFTRKKYSYWVNDIELIYKLWLKLFSNI